MTTSSTEQPSATREDRVGARKEFVATNFGVLSISVVFVILFAFFSLQTDAFLTTNNLVNVLRQVAPTVVVAMAMTFVITTGAIDLSVGSIVGLDGRGAGDPGGVGQPGRRARPDAPDRGRDRCDQRSADCVRQASSRSSSRWPP